VNPQDVVQRKERDMVARKEKQYTYKDGVEYD